MRKPYLISYFTMASLIWPMVNMWAQSGASHPAPPTVERDYHEEQRLTGVLVNAIRKQSGPMPTIVKPNDFDLQMTCNVAIDPSQIKNAESYGLTIVHGEASELPHLLERFADSAQATKDAPGLSIAVFRAVDAGGHVILTLGFSKIESHLNHLKGCLLTEDGCNDQSWQRAITPACKGLRR